MPPTLAAHRGALVAIAFGMNACASTLQPTSTPARAELAEASGDESLDEASVRLAPGDVIAISAESAPWLTGMYRIGGDGRLGLPRVDPMQAEGRLLSELAQSIEAATNVLDATLSLHVRLGARIAVAGEVRHPGLLVLRGSTTVSTAIAAMGGLTAWAAEDRIEVVRSRNGHSVRIHLSMRSTARAFVLQPGDAIVVPTHGIRPTADS